MVWRPIFILLWGMENFEEKASLCALNRIFGFDPKVALALISHLGSAAEVFRLSPEDIDGLLGPHSKYRDLIASSAVDQAAEELSRLQGSDILFTGWTEPDYPGLLKECPDAPVGLYVRTTTPLEKLWKPEPRIAVVGTRDISPYGKEWCEKTVRGLAASGSKPVIVSGLALGTDFYAHRTAIEEGVPTIGVMATGPEAIYPWRHREFAERLYHTEGCALVTDYPPGTAPLAIHFLRRNRIIAGLSDATVLVESRADGGGVITSKMARSYDREVFAVPGRIGDELSLGCNQLIRENCAEMVTDRNSVRSSLGWKNLIKDGGIRAKFLTFESDNVCKLKIIALLYKETKATIDDLMDKTECDRGDLVLNLTELELEGRVESDLIGRYMLKR